MKEYAIGEEFEFEGVKLRCVESERNLCHGCIFYERRDELDCGDVDCTDDRSDETNVIFEEVQNG